MRQVSTPCPVQIDIWKGQDIDPADGLYNGAQWLHCLKDTQLGDRQAVWTGVDGDGIVAVVDFNGDVRPREDVANKYEGWGRVTTLARPISVEEVRAHPALGPLFQASIQSVLALADEEGRAISEYSGGLPVRATFDGYDTDWAEEGSSWSRMSLPPERIVEDLVGTKSRIARKIGFRSGVEVQKILEGRGGRHIAHRLFP
jgi:hypothetical protein